MKNKTLPFEKYPTKFCFIFKKETFFNGARTTWRSVLCQDE